jgi:hypothetical protein
MAGLDPAIHVFAPVSQGVDARHKAGHDGLYYCGDFCYRHNALSGHEMGGILGPFREETPR